MVCFAEVHDNAVPVGPELEEDSIQVIEPIGSLGETVIQGDRELLQTMRRGVEVLSSLYTS